MKYPNQYGPVTLTFMFSMLFQRLLDIRISLVIKCGPRQKVFAKCEGICENLYY